MEKKKCLSQYPGCRILPKLEAELQLRAGKQSFIFLSKYYDDDDDEFYVRVQDVQKTDQNCIHCDYFFNTK